MHKILVSDPIAEEGINVLKSESDIQVDVKLKLPAQEIIPIISDYDALVVRSETKVTQDIINASGKLKVIGRAGVGIDNVDVLSATRKGIIVMNTPDGNTISTAEHTMSMLTALSRNIPQADKSVKDKKWDRKKFMGVQLYDKILGIIGLGRIGKEVAKRAKSFGMKIIAYDPYLSEEQAKKLEIKLVEFDEIISTSDYITVHTPLTEKTKYLIGKKEIEKMKDGVRLINCARGGLIEEKSLYDGLKSGKIGGAALDVYEKEPPLDNPLFELENIVLTPHLGASTEEAQISVAIAVARQIIDLLKHGIIKNAVNIPAISNETWKILTPYLTISEKIGAVLSQISEGRIKEAAIGYNGQITNYDTEPLTLAIMKGVLAPIVPDFLNYVNAPIIAKERGISIIESRIKEPKDYSNLITLKLTTDKCVKEIAGTVFGEKDIRIVKLEGYDVDIDPPENLLVVYNNDKPGVIGAVGTLLGRENVNISTMQVARNAPGECAVAMFSLDNPIDKSIIEKISKIENIFEVKCLKL